jgi:hypothetical protein
VYGTVTERDSGQEARVSEAVVSFIRSDGILTTVLADRTGEYRITIPSGYAYSVRVSRKGCCPAGRPLFEARSHTVIFNFLLTTNCPRDLVVNPGRENTKSVETRFCASTGRYYCDEEIEVANIPAIVRFVRRKAHDHVVAYSSHFAHSTNDTARSAPTTGYSVILAFDTTTVTADTIMVDLKKAEAVARGNVSITHDSDEIAYRSGCMNVFITDVLPIARPCQ